MERHVGIAGATRRLAAAPIRVAARLRSGELPLMDDSAHERRLVLEQDTAITGQEPPVGRGPVLDVKASIDYLTNLAPGRERVTS